MINSTSTCAPSDASGTIVCLTTYAQRSSTDPTIVNGFSAGSIVIAVFLFVQIALLSILTYHLLFRRVKVKNQ